MRMGSPGKCGATLHPNKKGGDSRPGSLCSSLSSADMRYFPCKITLLPSPCSVVVFLQLVFFASGVLFAKVSHVVPGTREQTHSPFWATVIVERFGYFLETYFIPQTTRRAAKKTIRIPWLNMIWWLSDGRTRLGFSDLCPLIRSKTCSAFSLCVHMYVNV